MVVGWWHCDCLYRRDAFQQKSLLFLPLSLSVNMKLICTRCETGQKSSQSKNLFYKARKNEFDIS
jgi:hypothetical protein